MAEGAGSDGENGGASCLFSLSKLMGLEPLILGVDKTGRRNSETLIVIQQPDGRLEIGERTGIESVKTMFGQERQLRGMEKLISKIHL